MLLWSFRVVFIGLILGFFVVHGYIIGDPCSAPVFSSPNTIGPCRNHTLACDPDLQLCVLRGCRSEEFSANWPQNWQLPPLCNKDTEYCPDSQLKCQPKIKMGDICSPGRDDSCDTSQGICLNQRCNAKNATLNQACILDTLTLYNMNRDNCIIGSFCSIGDNTCVSTFAKGQSCTEDRQCVTGACKKGICSEELEYNRIPYWIYIIIGCGAGIILVSCLLYIYLRRRKRMQRYKKTVSQHENVLREMVINLPNTEPNEHPDENSNHATTSIPQAPPQLPPPEF